MKIFFKVLLYTILILIVALIVGVVIFLKTFNLNEYKDQIASMASKALGRELKINGNASLGISLVPTIVLEDIQLANAPWANTDFMVKVKKVEVSFAILPLLKKQIVVDNVELVDPEINLEVAKDGKANWVFEAQDVDVTEDKAAEVVPVAPEVAAKVGTNNAGGMAMLAGLAARKVAITNGVVAYGDGQTGSVMNLVINKIALSIPSADENINASVDVVFNDNKIVADAVVGSINSFLDNKPFAVTLNAKAFGASAKISGELKDIMKNLSYDLSVEASNPNGNMGAPEASFVGQVDGDLKAVSVVITSLEVAKNKVTGKASADIAGKVPSVTADLKSEVFDLTKFSNPQKISYVAPGLISSAQASSMVPNEVVPYQYLSLADAVVNVEIGRLIIQQSLQANNVVLASTLKNGVLNVNPLSLNFGSGSVTLQSEVDGNNQRMTLAVLSKGLMLQDFHKEFVVEGKGDFGVENGGAVDVDINVSSMGNTYRQLVQALNGQAIVIVGKTEFASGSASFFSGTFFDALAKALKIDKLFSNDINLNCAVVRADFAKGKAVFPNGIALDSTKLNLSSNGSINLVNESLNFTLQPSIANANVSNIAQTLTSFLKVSGSLQDPKIGIDDKEAVKTAVGVALNAPMYVGGSLLLEANAAPCYTALQNTKYQTMFPKPEGVAATGQQGVKDAAQAVKDSVKDITKSTKQELKNLGNDSKQDLKDLKESGKQLLNNFKALGKI